ncbi:hypothetical protein A2686_00885 [Candidatus Woesebacteria bacterium RIFCSPHIGHO2_01_FULL_38_10]|uniref:Uncharacterized protein n=1 Tax=Candidatus Woesebacteria bacterium RIFCSPLOWO2_01_FULL_39_10b TaxID=1802517 RepID=A0A1F8B9D4_9BACT|nr:MAG: hypothetical protein A2686_00885 [Candidatus Woesebacteria bacterium RIFCSPHIGHO2_01_FULL_38_10]OGM60662.1 MAG: hypothetical protein A2892_01280 [Candidatus Woesebacteria bacterium RIFCSPLOWO2_01_FULL_39_10b]
MKFEESEFSEKLKVSATKAATNILSFQEAIEMGEYDPSYLANYPEWHQFPRHTQFQYIRKALDNRRKQLLTQWAEVNNVLDFNLKPEVQKAAQNIKIQLDRLERDREKLYLEYSS